MKNIFRLLLTFLFLSALLPVFASGDGITIISDSHISSDKANNKMTPSIKNLKTAVEQANSDTSGCVVFLGDNAKGASRYDIAMFAKIIKKLKKPYYVVAGNRDINRAKNVNKKEFYRIINKYSSNKVKKIPSYTHYKDYVFVFMSGVNETFPTYNGYYKENELEFLDKTLSKFKDKDIIIFQHFPVIEPKEDKNRKTYKPEEYLDILKKHNNVIAVISGHYHFENIQEDENGVKHISVGALAQGEYEQIKIFKNKDGSHTITTKIINIE